MALDRLVACYTIPDEGLVDHCRFETIYHEKAYTYVVKFPSDFVAKANWMPGREMRIYSNVYLDRVVHVFIIGCGDENAKHRPSFEVEFTLKKTKPKTKRIQNRRMAVDERQRREK